MEIDNEALRDEAVDAQRAAARAAADGKNVKDITRRVQFVELQGRKVSLTVVDPCRQGGDVDGLGEDELDTRRYAQTLSERVVITCDEERLP